MFFDRITQVERDDIELRKKKMAEAMAENGCDSILLRTNSNLYYATGLVPDGYFYMNGRGDERLFLRRPLTWMGEGVVPIKHPAELPKKLIEEGFPVPKRLMMEEDLLPYGEYVMLLGLFGLDKGMPSFMRRVRMVKTPYEQEKIRECGRIHTEVMKGVAALYRPGMTDLEFSIAIEQRFREHGHIGKFRTYGHKMDAFMGCVLSGDNGGEPSPLDFALGGAGENPTLPFGACGRLMRKGETVLVDISGSFNGYMSDMSRTYSLGKLMDAAYNAHNVALEIIHYIEEHARPGICVSELYQGSLKIAEKHGLSDCFMGSFQQSKFVGHGLGIEMNEPPVLTTRDETILAPGIPLALEPKFVLKGIGPVGTENTYLVTENGFERLTWDDDAMIELAV